MTSVNIPGPVRVLGAGGPDLAQDTGKNQLPLLWQQHMSDT